MAGFKIHIPDKIKVKLTRYQFEIRHIIIIFFVLISFQVILVFFQKATLDNFLKDTQSWFQKYYAERLALVTTTNVELLYEHQQRLMAQQDSAEMSLAHSLNVIFKQQHIHRSVDDICLILVKEDRIYIIDNGQKMYAYFYGMLQPYNGETNIPHQTAVQFYFSNWDYVRNKEKIISAVTDEKTFDVMVPFVPDGELLGVLYFRISPDFSFLTTEIATSFDRVALIFTTLILAGLIGIFVVSSRAVRERNKVQEELFLEHEENLEKQIRLEKESLFTKRIYHTHHKAEKIMGFIKEDVRKMNPDNLRESKQRVITYSNFISRIIYDMKWYDQDINTIKNPMFHTNVNSVIEFIVHNVFLRISSKNEMFELKLDLDPSLPIISVNEFNVWEILEPLIQNSIDHCGVSFVTISIQTKYDRKQHISYIYITDNGIGIIPELLETNSKGIKKLFLENETTKRHSESHSGYGCYIAHQLAVGKCGWQLEVENLPGGGCKFTIVIKN
ncbi:MAG: sensor histidine kinase [Bacteroidetes bacterium]|nr:sensor histidine kinase [Bacteroidota bacterium]